MELIPYLLGGFVLFVLFSSLARARTPPFKVPTFSVFVLGTRGSGKTVFMASMFQRLLAYSEERGYYLRCTDEKLKRRLLETSSKVLAVDQGWPDANMNAIEYPFECAYETKPVGAPDTLCRFTYLDYPGGWLSEADPPKEFSIKKKTQDAHAILVLLDGQKIKDFMDDVNDNVTSDILLLTSVLQQCSPSLKPIYFLITKSDLLDNSQYGFEKTQEALFRIPAFWDFVSTQATKSQLRFRMIFVSAVGPSFCMRDVRTGKMRKLSGGTWSPINIDKSISMTLLDQVRLVADQLDDYVVKKVARGEKTQDYLGKVKEAVAGLPGNLSLSATVDNLGVISGTMLQMARKVDKFATDHMEANRADLERFIQTSTAQKAAFARFIDAQHSAVVKFENENPRSNLSNILS